MSALPTPIRGADARPGLQGVSSLTSAGAAPQRGAGPFTRLEQRLFDALVMAGAEFIGVWELQAILYGRYPRGDKAVWTLIARLRRKLKGSGFTVAMTKNHGYRLSRTEAS